MSGTSSIAWEKRKLGRSRVILIENPRKRWYDDQSDPQGKHWKGTAHSRKQGTANQSTLKYCKIMVRAWREIGTDDTPKLDSSSSQVYLPCFCHVLYFYCVPEGPLRELVSCVSNHFITHTSNWKTHGNQKLDFLGKQKGTCFPTPLTKTHFKVFLTTLFGFLLALYLRKLHYFSKRADHKKSIANYISEYGKWKEKGLHFLTPCHNFQQKCYKPKCVCEFAERL